MQCHVISRNRSTTLSLRFSNKLITLFNSRPISQIVKSEGYGDIKYCVKFSSWEIIIGFILSPSSPVASICIFTQGKHFQKRKKILGSNYCKKNSNFTGYQSVTCLLGRPYLHYKQIRCHYRTVGLFKMCNAILCALAPLVGFLCGI